MRNLSHQIHLTPVHQRVMTLRVKLIILQLNSLMYLRVVKLLQVLFLWRLHPLLMSYFVKRIWQLTQLVPEWL